MTVLWLLTGASLAAAIVAWLRAHRTARRLEQLSQMYWELKYQHGELRVLVQRLTGGAAPASHPPPPEPDGFVPLSSLRRDRA